MALRSISLFSGCGGLDLGLGKAGFSTVLATDVEPLCCETFRRNFPEVPFLTKRIGEIDRADLVEALGQRFEDVDLLAGGPPCPPFSKSRFYRKDKPRALDDPNGWETIDGYLKVLDWTRPRAFLLENVKGLAYKVHRDALETIMQRAERLGYHAAWGVLNAANFGVPQIRERCFVIGSLEGKLGLPEATHTDRADKHGLLPWETAGSAIRDLDTEENASDDGHYAGGRYNELLTRIPPGENYLHFTAERGHQRPLFKWRSRYWSFLLKLSSDMPSWTIQARRSNNMGPFHWRNRILRIEEIKRLQTFPKNYFLAGTVEQQWRQIGNAVPPLLAEAVGKVLAAHLLVAFKDAA